MNRLLVIVVLLLAVTCLVSGHPQTSPPPKPGPEVLRLGSFIGTWKTETETVTWEWFTGGFSLIGHVENSGPEGKSSELRIITYDPDAKDYTQYRVTSTAPGGTLGHMTVVEVTPASATAKLEVSVAGGPWTVTFETKSVKIK